MRPVGVLPAVALWQPVASLTMLDDGSGRMVKRFETRSYKPPRTIVGKRVLIHAAKKPFGFKSDRAEVVRSCSSAVWNALHKMIGGDPELWESYPLGCLVGSAVIGVGLPIVQFHSRGPGHHPDPLWTPNDGSGKPPFPVVAVNNDESAMTLFTQGVIERIQDQRPFGDWTPGRWAWPLIDPRPLAEPVPYRGAQGVFYVDEAVLGGAL